MYQPDITGTLEQANFLFPPEWVRVALVLAPLNIWVVITLFAHLNRTTRKPHFDLWTVAWAFCSVCLAPAHWLSAQDAVKQTARLREFYRLSRSRRSICPHGRRKRSNGPGCGKPLPPSPLAPDYLRGGNRL